MILKQKIQSSNQSAEELDIQYEREDCEYKFLSNRFKLGVKDFTKQFAHIYVHRLEKVRPVLQSKIKKKWGKEIPVFKLFELEDHINERCIVIGTLFKHQELRPSTLKEFSEELQLNPLPPRTHFTDDADKLILEDELQRIVLIGKLEVHSVVTGIVCAVLGKEDEGGKFYVEDYCWTGVQSNIERPLPSSDHRFVVFVSGLNLCNSHNSLLPFQLFVDWVSGFLGESQEQSFQAKAVRVIIAGNGLRAVTENQISSVPNLYHPDSTNLLESLKLMDNFLVQLTSCINVDLMPGEFDPVNHMLPQQPPHYCLFPQASSYKTMHSVTNPYDCEIGGRRVTGTSGQPVKDISSYSNLTNRLEILESTLKWGHIAPTCPDSLASYPYYKDDPFIIEEWPDIYFAGNQPKFETKLYKDEEDRQVRLICVPSFFTTHTCAVVNLSNLDCYPVCFEASTGFSSQESSS